MEIFTNAEGLPNHYEAIRGRMKWKMVGLKKKSKNFL
jgi:hypothetical protein